MRTAIWWLRRDLRLEDNVALQAALRSAERVIPLFVLDPKLLRSPFVGEKRIAFLFGGLRRLDESLRERGSRLVIREGDPGEALGRLLAETGAGAVFVEKDVSPYGRARDQRVAGAGLPLRGAWGLSLVSPREIVKPDGKPYATFAPYARAFRLVSSERAMELERAPAVLPTPPAIDSRPLPACPVLPASPAFAPGEEEAERILERFAGGPIYRYAETRDRMDLEGTSGLSPYLRFGMISARRVYAAAAGALARAPDARARASAEAFRTELIWREFYLSILYHFPAVRRGSFRPGARGISWRDDEEGFRAWCEGRTGYPVIDAAMRQLSQTGFMPNRARMLVASFLAKHLLVDWRRGERWFMQHLVDGDPAANNGNWQWCAGTGTDAAPFFRIFNPTLQAKRFDPQGRYVRRFLPELEGLTAPSIHEPREPIVSHTQARIRALAAFQAARGKGSR